jgi:hypothetical protein
VDDRLLFFFVVLQGVRGFIEILVHILLIFVLPAHEDIYIYVKNIPIMESINIKESDFHGPTTTHPYRVTPLPDVGFCPLRMAAIGLDGSDALPEHGQRRRVRAGEQGDVMEPGVCDANYIPGLDSCSIINQGSQATSTLFSKPLRYKTLLLGTPFVSAFVGLTTQLGDGTCP